MAQNKQGGKGQQNQGAQGTGKHPHKKTSEPYPHTKEEGTAQGGKQGGKKDQ